MLAHINLHLPDLNGAPIEEIGGILSRHFVNRWEGDLAEEMITVLLRSAVTGDGPDSELRAGLISSQLLGVALSRHILALPPVAALDAETLIEALTPVLNHFLSEPLGHSVRARRGYNGGQSVYAA